MKQVATGRGGPAASGYARAVDRIVDWLVDRLSSIHDLGEDPLDQDVFQSGWLDSFGIILLVEDLEAEFGVRLGNNEFQDARFSTIRGIAELVNSPGDG